MSHDHPEGDGQERGESTSDRPRSDRDATERWFANATVRLGLTLIGLVLLLFALGQAFGLPLLDVVADALTTHTGAWLAVAFFALLLIVAAQRGIPGD